MPNTDAAKNVLDRLIQKVNQLEILAVRQQLQRALSTQNDSEVTCGHFNFKLDSWDDVDEKVCKAA